MVVRKLDHVGVMVNDLNESVQFYRDVLGLEVKRQVQVLAGYTLVFMGYAKSSETVIELVPRAGDFAEAGRVHHIAFTVDSMEAAIAHLRQHQVRWIDQEPHVLPDGAEYCFFYGPNGEHLELFQPGSTGAKGAES